MRPEELPTAESPAISRRIMASSRPWLLIAAALLLAVLSTILWAKSPDLARGRVSWTGEPLTGWTDG